MYSVKLTNFEASDDQDTFKYVKMDTEHKQERNSNIVRTSSSRMSISSHVEPVSPGRSVIASPTGKCVVGKFSYFDNRGSFPKDPASSVRPCPSDVTQSYFDRYVLSAPRLNPRLPPGKNCCFLAPVNPHLSNESPLSALGEKICKTLREVVPCEFDVKASKCKWRGVYRDGCSACVTFAVRIYSVVMKKCGSARHLIAARRLSGDSIAFRRLFAALKAEICDGHGSATRRISTTDTRDIFLANRDLTLMHGTLVQKEMARLFEMVETNYLDQQIFALGALSRIIQSNEATKRLVVGNIQFMKSLINIFDLTDGRYCQSQYHCHLLSELQYHATVVLRELSEDSFCISALVNNGILLRCFESLYLLAKYEVSCKNISDECVEIGGNIKYWYRQSHREIAKCLTNITLCPTIDAVEALLGDGVENQSLHDWCELSNHFSCEILREEAKKFVPVF